jgi:hypothetical protein
VPRDETVPETEEGPRGLELGIDVAAFLHFPDAALEVIDAGPLCPCCST